MCVLICRFVGFHDARGVRNAVSWFNGKKFHGRSIIVEESYRTRLRTNPCKWPKTHMNFEGKIKVITNVINFTELFNQLIIKHFNAFTVLVYIYFRSTFLSRPDKVGLKCLFIRPSMCTFVCLSVCTQKVSSISRKLACR